MRRVLHVHVKVLARVHVEKGAATFHRRLATSSNGRGEGRLADYFPDLGILEELTQDGVGRVHVGGQVFAVARRQVANRRGGRGGAGCQLRGTETLVRRCSQWRRRAAERQLSNSGSFCSRRYFIKRRRKNEKGKWLKAVTKKGNNTFDKLTGWCWYLKNICIFSREQWSFFSIGNQSKA